MIKQCTDCDRAPVLGGHTGKQWGCTGCGTRGPENDRDGERWNRLVTRAKDYDAAFEMAVRMYFRLGGHMTVQEDDVMGPRTCTIRVDDPVMDATDGAHPAWWRGVEHVATHTPPSELAYRVNSYIEATDPCDKVAELDDASRDQLCPDGTCRYCDMRWALKRLKQKAQPVA